MKAPPLSPYGSFQGTLFSYYCVSPLNLVAFESSPYGVSSTPDVDALSKNKCILIGGLSDGLIPTPYTSKLEKMCHSIGWSLVQPLISSSYLGFGHGSLSRDTEEMDHLINYLAVHRSAENVCIVGHSTGCQNSVHFMKHGNKELQTLVKVIALQAPVSDRESAMLQTKYSENIDHALQLKKEGKGDELMPRNSFWAPITASRFVSLQHKSGVDDMFSSDLTDVELMERLGHIGKHHHLHALVAFSGSDEYVPDHVDKDLLLERMCGAMNRLCDPSSLVATPLMIPNGNHNLKGEDDSDIFTEELRKALESAAI